MESCCHPLPAEGAVSIDLLLILVTGLTVSLGHCVAMCGPIQAAFSLEQESRGGRCLPPLLRYHLGRVTGYVFIGGAFGLLGSAVRLGGAALALQGGFAIALAALMAAFVLGGWSAGNLAAFGESFGPTRLATRGIRRFLAARTRRGQIALGVANGFLPCGPVLAVALTAAAAADPLVGMGLMAVYGLGTAPALLVLGAASSRLGPVFRRRMERIGNALILLVALQLLLRGLATLGVVPHLRAGSVVIW